MEESGASLIKPSKVEWEVIALEANAGWIRRMHAQGYSFIDIGIDASPNRSPFYVVERSVLAEVGAKVYKGSPKKIEAARKNSRQSKRPPSKTLCPI